MSKLWRHQFWSSTRGLGALRPGRSIVWDEVDGSVNFGELWRIAPMTIEAEAMERPGLGGAPALPGRPDMLSHVAYITHDTTATVEFYTTLLGMDLAAEECYEMRPVVFERWLLARSLRNLDYPVSIQVFGIRSLLRVKRRAWLSVCISVLQRACLPLHRMRPSP